MICYIKNLFTKQVYPNNKIGDMKSNIRGFSLVEVMVTIGIFSILATITYTSYPSANNIIAFSMSSQEFIARIRNAQIYGASSGGNYKGSGIFLQTDSSNIVNKNVIEYLDATTTMTALGVYDSNKYYDDQLSSDPDKIAVNKVIDNGVFVNRLCVKNYSSATPYCGSAKLSIAFIRPDTQANITDYSEQVVGIKSFFDIGYVELKAPYAKAGSDIKCIQIFKNGQVSIINDVCN